MKKPYQKITLKNGLRIILVPDDSRPVMTTMVLFGVGSRYESEAEAGISHVLEHMHYKGTKKRQSPLSIAEFVENIGGEHNAFTAKEYTGYYVKAASKHLGVTIEFLADILTNSTFDPLELEREKKVVLSELDMYEDLPMEVVASDFELTLFGKNSLGRDVIGYKESIQAVDQKALFAYRDKYYTTKNAVVVVAGNLGNKEQGTSNEELVKQIERNFTFSTNEAPAFEPVKLPSVPQISRKAKKTEQSHFVIGFPGVMKTDPDRYALSMMSLILGGSMSSRMFMEIREKRGLAYAVRTSSSNYLDAGAIETYAGVDNSRAEEAIKAVRAEYERIKLGVLDRELSRAKEFVSGHFLIGLEDSSEVASHYGVSEILTGEIMTPDEIVEKYRALTVEDVTTMAKKYLDNDKITLSFVGNVLSEEELKQLIK